VHNDKEKGSGNLQLFIHWIQAVLNGHFSKLLGELAENLLKGLKVSLYFQLNAFLFQNTFNYPIIMDNYL
jgi:hypothetical protein